MGQALHALAHASRALALAAALGCAMALLPAPAEAQFFDESSANTYWTLEKQRQDRLRASRTPTIRQKPTHLIRRAAPVRGYARPLESAPPQTNEDGSPATAASAAPTGNELPAASQAQTKANVAVLGDTLGQLLGVGLGDAFADRPEITILRRTKENSGLVREDYHDWQKASRELLAAKDKPDIAIVMVGSNDRQSMRDGTANHELRSPKWKEIYAARAKAIGAVFRERNIPLIWVGLPIMNNERLSADMLEFNEIYKTAARETGASYVDIWEAFADDRGQFSSYGPDVNGQMVRLRSSDGVHFTRAGARKLAHFVENEIRNIFEKNKPALDPAALANLPGASGPAATPQAARNEPAPAPVLKPVAGPVVPLNAPPVSAGGILLGPATTLPSGDREAAALLERSLVRGQAPEARPGRADDFSWPR